MKNQENMFMLTKRKSRVTMPSRSLIFQSYKLLQWACPNKAVAFSYSFNLKQCHLTAPRQVFRHTASCRNCFYTIFFQCSAFFVC